jgi:lysophospholipase L1-like esterase
MSCLEVDVTPRSRPERKVRIARSGRPNHPRLALELGDLGGALPLLSVLLLAPVALLAFLADAAGAERQPITYLALGDSYTIGEGVAADGRWPVQLARALRRRGIGAGEPRIVARTGWTVGELGEGIDAAAPRGPFDLVSLLIGVNDQYRGGDPEVFRSALAAMLRRAAGLAGGRPGRVLVLSIPDWGVTPFAARSGRDASRIAQELQRFNEVVREEARRLGCPYVDITPESRQAQGRGELLAADGLHPSSAMYAEWAQLALPAAADILKVP